MKYLDEICKDFVNILPFNHLSEDDFPLTTENDLVFIDQDLAHPSNRNEAGWIRNDVSAFELCEVESQAASILARFDEIKSDDLYKDMTEEEMFETCMDRRAMSDPVFYARAMQIFANNEFKRLEKEKERQESEKQMKDASVVKDIINKEAVDNSSVDSGNNSTAAS